MWLRFRFTLFGREIWSFEVDEDGLSSLSADEFSEEFDEEEYEDDEEEPALRWGEPCVFERDIFIADQSV